MGIGLIPSSSTSGILDQAQSLTVHCQGNEVGLRCQFLKKKKTFYTSLHVSLATVSHIIPHCYVPNMFKIMIKVNQAVFF